MMADFEHNDNSGSMFFNERKSSPKHPDRTGSCKIDGVDYWVSGWVKESKKEDGKAWMSLSFTPKEGNGGSKTQGRAAQPRAGGIDDMDDDIPF